MHRYSPDSILCNGREIALNDILNTTPIPGSAFEASVFSFVRQWLGGQKTFIQKTSGSTGTPKEISIRRDQMIASAKLTQEALQLKKGDTAFVCLDPEYIAGKMMLVRSFVTGMNILAADPSTNPFQDIPETISVDFLALVPMQIYEILKSPEASRLNSIKNILVGGAALNPETMALLSKFNTRVFATYGMTETVSHIALQAVNGPETSEYFTVLPGIKIASDDRGCLIIDAPYCDERINTNDLVEIKDSTQFKWLGRVDNIINTGGVKVIPEKIEAQLNTYFSRHGIQNKFLIAGVPDAMLGSKIVLLIEGDISLASVDTMKNSLRQMLPPYEVPKEIFGNANFVVTKNGKINRSETVRHFGIQHRIALK